MRQDSEWSLVGSLSTSSGSGELVGSNLLEVGSEGVCVFGAVSSSKSLFSQYLYSVPSLFNPLLLCLLMFAN